MIIAQAYSRNVVCNRRVFAYNWLPVMIWRSVTTGYYQFPTASILR
jgi:hypothetical protein